MASRSARVMPGRLAYCDIGSEDSRVRMKHSIVMMNRIKKACTSGVPGKPTWSYSFFIPVLIQSVLSTGHASAMYRSSALLKD